MLILSGTGTTYTASRISLGNLKVDTGYPVVFLNDSHLLMAKIYLF